MADYEPGHYRSGFEDDERRAPYATDFGARSETRYATGYGYGPTYGGTAGAYGSTYGGVAPGAYGYGSTTGGYGGTAYSTPGYTTAGGYGRTEVGYGGTTRYGGIASEGGLGTGRYGTTRYGRRQATTFGARGWRDEGIGERRYPDHGQAGSGWTHQEENRYGEPGRAGINQSVTGLQEFGAYGPGVPVQRRRIGTRQYGPY